MSEVFVGNRCIGDNIAECVKVAIFNAIGKSAHDVAVAVDRGVARLDGVVNDEGERAAATAAAVSQPGIEAVDDRLSVASPPRMCRRERPMVAGSGAITERAPSSHPKSGDLK